MSITWTILSLLNTTRGFFERSDIPSARLDAEVLMTHVLQEGRVYLYTHGEQPLTQEEVDEYRELVKRRSAGEPVAYLVEEKEFYSLPFAVGPGVLIPRPETEGLVDRAVHILRQWAPKAPKVSFLPPLPEDASSEVEDAAPNAGSEAVPSPTDGTLEAGEALEARPLLLLDVCTGSGCIPLTLLKEVKSLKAIGSDISEEALAYAKKNREAMGLTEQLGLVQGADFDAIPARFKGQFDLITANPPYLTQSEMKNLQREVRIEPALALDGGQDGLDPYERLIPASLPWLKPGGHLLMEIGKDQGDAVAGMMKAAGLIDVQIHQDLARLPRLVEGRRRQA